jgi:uncharacterized OB-fold protein
MPGYIADLEDSAADRFYSELADGRFMTTRCNACELTFFPPRSLCPTCLGTEVEWVELSGRGSVYAFTQQHYAILFTKPEVVGVIELEGCSGRMLALIGARFEDIRIGMPVRAEFFESPFDMTLVKFVPEQAAG